MCEKCESRECKALLDCKSDVDKGRFVFSGGDGETYAVYRLCGVYIVSYENINSERESVSCVRFVDVKDTLRLVFGYRDGGSEEWWVYGADEVADSMCRVCGLYYSVGSRGDVCVTCRELGEKNARDAFNALLADIDVDV
jgi:hypothetical protein